MEKEKIKYFISYTTYNVVHSRYEFYNTGILRDKFIEGMEDIIEIQNHLKNNHINHVEKENIKIINYRVF